MATVSLSYSQLQDASAPCCFGHTRTEANAESFDQALKHLTEELNALSVEEREKVFDDIHGVSEAQEETPEFVALCIEKLNAELKAVPKKRRHALDRAFFLKPNLDKDNKFKLMFLRADNYDAFKSARRMSQYFTDKLELFGEEKLVKKITLDDLTEEDMEVFNTGFFKVLDEKDSVGRTIWLNDLPKYQFDRPLSVMRCTWYQIRATLEDETVQLKGAVAIVYCPQNMTLAVSMGKFSSIIMKLGGIVMNMPCLTTSNHYCSNDSGLVFLRSLMSKAAGKQKRLRSRSHFGSAVEIQYELMTFGIQCPAFLFALDSEAARFGLEYFRQYLLRRYVKDRRETNQEQKQAMASGVSLYPNQNDVLVGRGVPYQNFAGNRYLGRLIEESYLERYREVTDRFEKTCIHMEVMKEIQDGGGRFLETTPDGWIVVADEVARSKVWSAFRNKLAKQKSSDDIDAGPTKRMRRK